MPSGIAANIYVWKCQTQIFWFWWNVIGTSVTLIVVCIVYFLHPYALKLMQIWDKNAQFQQNMGLTNLQQNSMIIFPVSKESIEKCLTNKDNNLFEPRPIVWNRQIIGYSIAFFAFMILVSFLLERIL